MNRRSFIKFTGSAAVLAGAMPAIAANKKKTNIVFFLVDDMGWQETSEPFWTERTKLNDRYKTPNMVKLARQGMKLSQAYACAVCSPTRVSLMTGANAARHRVTTWTRYKNWSPDPKVGRKKASVDTSGWNENGMSMKVGERCQYVVEETLPSLLKKEGYKTIHVGKAHFAAKDTSSEDPRALGFDINIAGNFSGGPKCYYGIKNFKAHPSSDGVPGLEKYHGTNIYLTEALTREANAAVGQAVREDKPFYLYMSHYAVHCPWNADPRFLPDGTDPEKLGSVASLPSMIQSMDKSLGDIMDNLKKLGVEDNTVIVFMSDNGSPKQMLQNAPLRGHKITPYEGGVRVPMIVKWPGVTKADSVCSEDYLIIEDIFPTLLEIAGAPAYRKDVDGKSFVPLLKGERGISKGRPIFWHYPNTFGQVPYSSVRLDNWKLIYYHVDSKFELYNIKEDIGEKHDMAASNVDKVKELVTVLSNHLRSVDAHMAIRKGDKEPIPYPDEV